MKLLAEIKAGSAAEKFIFMILLITLCVCSSLAPDISAWKLLKEMLLLPGVSTREDRVAEMIASKLPSPLKGMRDEMGNV